MRYDIDFRGKKDLIKTYDGLMMQVEYFVKKKSPYLILYSVLNIQNNFIYDSSGN